MTKQISVWCVGRVSALCGVWDVFLLCVVCRTCFCSVWCVGRVSAVWCVGRVSALCGV